MVIEAQHIKQARNACGLSLEAAAKLINTSVPTYSNCENHPEKMKIGQFFRMYQELDDFAAGRMWDYLVECRELCDEARKGTAK